MAFTIYKSGQGYWTRTMTAIGIGVVVLTGVAWLWSELEIIGRSYSVNLEIADASARLAAWGKANNHEIAGLDVLRGIQTPDAATTSPVTITGAGQTFTLDRGGVVAAIEGFAPAPTSTAVRALPVAGFTQVRIEGGNVVFGGIQTWGYRNRLYIQSAVAVVVIAIFGVLTFWVLNKPNIADFMIATEAEMKKVNWPSRREIIGSTWVVIVGMLLFGLILFVVDVGFLELFRQIGILQG